MKLLLGLFMLLCYVPTSLIILFICYPKEWKNRKIIFGVLNRDEFKAKENADYISYLVKKTRRNAAILIMTSIALAAIFLLIPDMSVMMIVYTLYILAALIIILLPYIKGNLELKSYKTELGITSTESLKQVDLKSITASHAINKLTLFIPLILNVVVFICALLYDLGIITIGKTAFKISFGATVFSGTFLFTSILFVIIAFMMDNMRNEIISTDSDINANYNRAKKKNWADAWVQFLWVNVVFTILCVLCVAIYYNEIVIIGGFTIYVIVDFILIASLVKKSSMIKSNYEIDIPIDDDDDNWIFGMIYYNPNDMRLNVEKRTGVGSTINMARPAGKFITVFILLCILETFVAMGYIGAFISTPFEVKCENDKIICHQFKDDYVIDRDDIKEVTYGDDITSLKSIKIGGIATDKLLKGNFQFDKDKNCKTFITISSMAYIRIETSDHIYYINANTKEETEKLYEQIK